MTKKNIETYNKCEKNLRNFIIKKGRNREMLFPGAQEFEIKVVSQLQIITM